jgi:TonB family protein
VKKHYAAHFKADTSNGIIFINTKDYVKKGGSKEVVSVVVNAKNPQQEAAEDIEMPKVFDVVENMPEFPGGMAAMMQFLSENVCYPEAAEKAGTQGRVIATFIVEKDGSITNIKIVKSVSKELDAEAKRVIEAMPNWKPGKQNGEPVRVKYTIPITFRLSSPSPSTQNQQAEPTKPVTQSTSN